MSERDVVFERWVEELINRVVAQHTVQCPVAPRVGRLEIRMAVLVGYMIGSGVIGGAAGGMLFKLIGG